MGPRKKYILRDDKTETEKLINSFYNQQVDYKIKKEFSSKI